MGKKIKIALLQCLIRENRQEMNKYIENLIKKAVYEEVDLIILPEKWRPIINSENLTQEIQKERGIDYSFIKKLSSEYSTSIISGGIWEKRKNNDEKSAFITSYYFNQNGEEIGRQDKLHLYSFEPNIFQPGNILNLFKYKSKNIIFSILICFDIAFYETPRASVENGADILISPTLIREEGLDNWKIYLQARALENRVPIVACNPIGTFFGRHFPGKSKSISFKTGHETPSVLLTKELEKDREDVLIDSINISYPKKIRKKRLSEKIQIPTIKLID